MIPASNGRLTEFAPGQEAHANLAHAVVVVLGIAELLDRRPGRAGRGHVQMLVDDERRRGAAGERLRDRVLALLDLSVGVGVVGRTSRLGHGI